MTWDHLDTAELNGSIFDLYVEEGTYMVRIDDIELMNGYWHESEDVLGIMAVRYARVPNPHILIGGLGLGYTLASVCRTMGDAGTVIVAEVSQAMIGWFDQYVMAHHFPKLPANARIVHNDISQIVKSGEKFDVIALDVDNGPEALCQPGNHFLYTEDGLAYLADCIGPAGILLVWSIFTSEEFEARAKSAGFHIGCKHIPSITGSDNTHYVYVLSLTAFSEDELKRIAD